VLIDPSYKAADLLKSRNIQTTLPKNFQNQGKTTFRVKQNKITCDILDISDKEELEKIVLVSNMLVNYIHLVQSK
jgi:hypothetical protein